jgi:nucleoid-associated protein YgaU
VEQVEWLALLSRKYYDTLYCWTLIRDANASTLADPDRLQPGMELTIPPASECGVERAGPPVPDSLQPVAQRRALSQTSAVESGERSGSTGPGTHTVERVEWLGQLSREYYDTLYCWPLIWKANRDVLDDPDTLRPGMELTIPPASECTIDRPGPAPPDSLQ